MRKYIYILAVLMATACGSDNKEPSPKENEVNTTISGITDDKWTYFSFSMGRAVGQSTFASDEEDAAWAKRSDWDFAICGDYLKTNGGTSGNGKGAVQRITDTNFDLLDKVPSDGFLVDTQDIVK